MPSPIRSNNSRVAANAGSSCASGSVGEPIQGRESDPILECCVRPNPASHRERRSRDARDRQSTRRRDGIRVAVLMGGPSSEHEVSLQGGANVVGALSERHFLVRPIVILRDGRWLSPPKGWNATAASTGAELRAMPRGSAARVGSHTPELGASALGFDARATDGWREYAGVWDGITALKDWRVDVVIPILHGAFGEDGTIQACLRAAGIPFIGSGVKGSALAFDKIRTKELLSVHGVRTPEFLVARTDAVLASRRAHVDAWVEALGLPFVVKNPCGGSTLEVRMVRDAGEAIAVVDELAPEADSLLIERYVSGRELTAGILEGDVCPAESNAVFADGLTSLPIVEIRPRSGQFFDYHEKYSAQGAEEICPAPIPAEVSQEAQAIGRLVHCALGLRGLSRTDLILTPEGTLEFLEVNTLPGMTSRGLVPQAAAVAGLPFPALIQALVRTSGVPR